MPQCSGLLKLFLLSVLIISSSTAAASIHLRKLEDGPITNKDLEKTKVHICTDKGEIFSGSYLISKGRLLNKKLNYDLNDVSCEFAVDMMISNTKKIFQTMDVLDLSVINLSLYERLLMQRAVDVTASIPLNATESIGRAGEMIRRETLMKRRVSTSKDTTSLPSANPYARSTVVLMPVLLSAQGTSFSKNASRKRYLSASFWSFYATYDNIVCFVMNDEDYHYVKHVSGLPFWRIILLTSLPTYASLPVASVQYTQKMMKENKWQFKYVFYTEADQVLLLRNPSDVYKYLEEYPKYFISPHRLTAFPEQILRDEFKRNINTVPVTDWKKLSCCMPRQDCTERNSWSSIADHAAAGPSLVNLYGMQVALGNSNFHMGTYRTCVLGGYLPLCPS